MMDACYFTKRARKISYIGETLNRPRPGVTRTVKEMEQKTTCKRPLPRKTVA